MGINKQSIDYNISWQSLRTTLLTTRLVNSTGTVSSAKLINATQALWAWTRSSFVTSVVLPSTASRPWLRRSDFIYLSQTNLSHERFASDASTFRARCSLNTRKRKSNEQSSGLFVRRKVSPAVNTLDSIQN